jgi:uncharacterized protein
MQILNSSIAEHTHSDATTSKSTFDEDAVLHELKHYLPAQAPLKDFIHHNTLHAFQKFKFFDGLRHASEIFGYKPSLTLHEYRSLYRQKRINNDVLERIIVERKGIELFQQWKNKVLYTDYGTKPTVRIGTMRSHWKSQFKIDLDTLVHPILFRVLCSYLDQGISMWNFPVLNKGFLESIREMERISFSSFFKTKRVRNLLLKGDCSIESLLHIVVYDKSLYTHYIFDQQFAHQGWSGMVSTIEDQPHTLLDTKKITLHDLIVFELLLEIDALDLHFGEAWPPLGTRLDKKPIELLAPVPETELHEVAIIWQEAFEWSYYDQVLTGMKMGSIQKKQVQTKSFQALFCIDDRECSLRRYLEKFDAACETFGTPGFFGVEFFFQPEYGKFYTKLCPAPVTPKYLIKEIETKQKRKQDLHFTKHTHKLFSGWLISQTLGFWAAIQLFINIFRPTTSPATASSFKHMDKYSKLSIENSNTDAKENNLQIGFTIEEMAQRVEGLLKSIGLVKDFAPLVYIVGHGSSSVNNPHYAAYDCGACSGRAGSVNSRVICAMANHQAVREILLTRGLNIPNETQFVGGLHDTTRDEIVFFDEDALTKTNAALHQKNEEIFDKALDSNAKERSRRFVSISTKQTAKKIHEEIRTRSVSLFEPRPELNHATNTLCIVGRRELSKNLFLDRRSFLNSYDYTIDAEGKYLFNILNAVAPVCGGINLEYYFSRVDNQKLGAGTKLPHNVMGLIGVANGIDGDLRPGLPSQMIEVHDPVRLLVIVEHFPEVVLTTILRNAATYEWFINEWIHLVVINPDTKLFYRFKDGAFSRYESVLQSVDTVADITPVLESQEENIPVYVVS